MTIAPRRRAAVSAAAIIAITPPMLIACDRPPAEAAPATTAAVPPNPPSEAAWFEQCAAERGLHFVHDSGHRGRYLMPESACGGAALFDMDGDGDLDAYLVQAGPLDAPSAARGNRLFRNRGGGVFDDVTAGSGADDQGYGMGVATGDFDNDGDNDLFVTNVGRNTLLANDGAGRFTDVTERAGVGHAGFGSAAVFFDFDGDGDLDLFVVNYLDWSPQRELDCTSDLGEPEYCAPAAYGAPAMDVLYRNEGDGTFTDVSVESGIIAAAGTGLGVVAGDFDGDGRTDIFVANDGMPDHLWINSGGGRFEERGMIAGCAIDQDGRAKAGMGVVAADLDDDGDEDLLVVNLLNESDSLFRNEGGWFADQTAALGLGAVSRPFTRFGVGAADFDNDGRLDLYEACGRVARQAHRYGEDPYAEPNLLLRGTGTGRFEEVLPRGPAAGAPPAASRAAAFGDIDGDGGIDVLVVNRDGPAHLLRNTVAQRGHWIAFRVVNDHGGDALGAAVSITHGERRITRIVRTASSYLAASDPRVHFGLGDATVARDIEVRWPDGTVQRVGDRTAGRVWELKR